MRRFSICVALTALLAAGACSGQKDLLDPVVKVVSQAEGIKISLRGEEILVENGAVESVRFAAIERRYFETALALWCMGSTECGKLVARGHTGSLALSDVSGYERGANEVLVFWWYDRPGATDEEKAAGVRRVTVQLQ